MSLALEWTDDGYGGAAVGSGGAAVGAGGCVGAGCGRSVACGCDGCVGSVSVGGSCVGGADVAVGVGPT